MPDLLTGLRPGGGADPGSELPDADTMATEQQHLDNLLAVAELDPIDVVTRDFGYIPAEPRWWTLFTYQFVHAGWLHLLANLWFLYFCGTLLEDRWGRVVFPAFYLTAGVASALLHGAWNPLSHAALIGASGSIASCMGAFAVAFARTRVRFLWTLSLGRTFVAPAWVVLGLWGVMELGSGVLFPRDTTAHWAHVGGFAFGALVAVVLQRTSLGRWLDGVVEVAAVLDGDARIDAARMLAKRGKSADALAMLEGLAIECPDSVVLHETIAEIARASGDATRAAAATRRAAVLRDER